jgi:hypothetical protein
LDIHEALWVVALLGFSDTDLFATMARSTRRQNMPKNHFFYNPTCVCGTTEKIPKNDF